MPKIIIDGRSVQCREGINVLQAALDIGIDVPHYCYHPGLSIVASCRLCLMEMKMPDPKTRELVWSHKLVPSCQTPARDGLEVRFETEKIHEHRKRIMEYYLLSHPLDCPVCDQAGECYLQDYSLKFGEAFSRMIDPKTVNPKKDVGSRTLLYQDRCVLCSRCVRFTREIAGTSELCLINRGHLAEIDAFPGQPLENKLQGNVVDICPVGALLDKDFLFAQRVWFLTTANSVCRACSTGCAIRIDQDRNRVYRLRPRWNVGVNDWWMCDDGRFGWKSVLDDKRLQSATVRRGNDRKLLPWESVPAVVRQRLGQIADRFGPASIAVQLSPEMACEEAWLLADLVRRIAPQATLSLGDVQIAGEPEVFPAGADGKAARFTIRPEKHPNRRGIEMILTAVGGPVLAREELWTQTAAGRFQALWIVGGYPTADWPTKALLDAAEKPELLIVQDMFPNKLTAQAEILLPVCAWTERAGSFMNHAGVLQPFERAVVPPGGGMHDGQYLWAIAGHPGLYAAEAARKMMASKVPAMADLHVPQPEPRYQH
jgi:NADH-quinone oxidoreductase subunit G